MSPEETTAFVTGAILRSGGDPAQYHLRDLVKDLTDQSAGSPMNLLFTSRFRRLLADNHL